MAEFNTNGVWYSRGEAEDTSLVSSSSHMDLRGFYESFGNQVGVSEQPQPDHAMEYVTEMSVSTGPQLQDEAAGCSLASLISANVVSQVTSNLIILRYDGLVETLPSPSDQMAIPEEGPQPQLAIVEIIVPPFQDMVYPALEQMPSSELAGAISEHREEDSLSSTVAEIPRPTQACTLEPHRGVKRGSEQPTNEDKPAKRIRTKIEKEQKDKLESVFKRSQIINTEERQRLAADVKLPDHVVRKWFQNRRVKYKNEFKDRVLKEAEQVPEVDRALEVPGQ